MKQDFKEITVSFEKLMNLGNYENQKMSVTVTIPDVPNLELEEVIEEVAQRIYAKIDEVQKEVADKIREENGAGQVSAPRTMPDDTPRADYLD